MSTNYQPKVGDRVRIQDYPSHSTFVKEKGECWFEGEISTVSRSGLELYVKVYKDMWMGGLRDLGSPYTRIGINIWVMYPGAQVHDWLSRIANIGGVVTVEEESKFPFAGLSRNQINKKMQDAILNMNPKDIGDLSKFMKYQKGMRYRDILAAFNEIEPLTKEEFDKLLDDYVNIPRSELA